MERMPETHWTCWDL